MENTINGYIPNSGRNHINKCMVNNRPFGIKKLLFANIPGVNQNTPRADDMSIPPTLQIVHEMNYTQVGYLDENTVAWTFALTPDDGDFTYNTLLLVSVDEEDKDYDNVLIAFDHIPLQHKVAGVASHHNRSFVIKTEAAAARNNITIPAQSWMFDQTPQINALQAQVATLASMQFRTQLQLLKQNIG